jgi:uncharacterized Zn finger protein
MEDWFDLHLYLANWGIRLDALAKRGDAVWRQVEEEIECRNASGYDRAASLLQDLEMLSEEQGKGAEFDRRLADLRERHARKERFLERLAALEGAKRSR